MQRQSTIVSRRILLLMEMINVFRKRGVEMVYHKEVYQMYLETLSKSLRAPGEIQWTEKELGFFRTVQSGVLGESLYQTFIQRV